MTRVRFHETLVCCIPLLYRLQGEKFRICWCCKARASIWLPHAPWGLCAVMQLFLVTMQQPTQSTDEGFRRRKNFFFHFYLPAVGTFDLARWNQPIEWQMQITANRTRLRKWFRCRKTYPHVWKCHTFSGDYGFYFSILIQLNKALIFLWNLIRLNGV